MKKTDQFGKKINEEEINEAAALKYDPEDGPVPRIVAQAKGELARRIVEVALEVIGTRLLFRNST